MRVISGSAKGRRLRSMPGQATRPITDRAKEALFNILAYEVQGVRFLDLFGGTGAVGIEALSRGAAEVVFVERLPAALRTISENLRQTNLNEKAQVIRGDAFRYLARPDLTPFDIIYIAPPQYQGIWSRALKSIDDRPDVLTPHGIAIAQIHPREDEELELTHLEEFDRRRYGSTLLIFYERV